MFESYCCDGGRGVHEDTDAFRTLTGADPTTSPAARQCFPNSRDAVHVSVMQRYGIWRVFGFDADFKRVTGIERLFT